MEKYIKEALKDISKLTAIKADGSIDAAEFDAKLKEAIGSIINENYLTDFTALLVKADGTEGEVKAKNTELFSSCQNEAINFYGDWNEEAVGHAVVSYLEQEGAFDGVKVPEVFVTYGELYSLKPEDELFKKESTMTVSVRKELADDKFAGPGKIFPITDTKHFLISRKLSARSTDKSVENLDMPINSPILLEDGTPIKTLNSVEDVDKLLEEKELYKESYSLSDEDMAKFTKFLENFKENSEIYFGEDINPLLNYSGEIPEPVILGKEFLYNYFVKHELVDSREYLLPLVSIVRSKKVTQTELENASKGYQVFSNSVLEKLLKKPIDVVVNESVGTINQLAPSKEVDDSDATVGESQPIQKGLSKSFFGRGSSRRKKD